MESCGEMEIAKNFYETSKDNLSLVRIYCYTDQVDKVIQVHESEAKVPRCLSNPAIFALLLMSDLHSSGARFSKLPKSNLGIRFS